MLIILYLLQGFKDIESREEEISGPDSKKQKVDGEADPVPSNEESESINMDSGGDDDSAALLVAAVEEMESQSDMENTESEKPTAPEQKNGISKLKAFAFSSSKS